MSEEINVEELLVEIDNIKDGYRLSDFFSKDPEHGGLPYNKFRDLSAKELTIIVKTIINKTKDVAIVAPIAESYFKERLAVGLSITDKLSWEDILEINARPSLLNTVPSAESDTNTP